MYKLLDLSVHLRELGHPEYIEFMMKESLNCAINRDEADQKVCVNVVCMCANRNVYIVKNTNCM